MTSTTDTTTVDVTAEVTEAISEATAARSTRSRRSRKAADTTTERPRGTSAVIRTRSTHDFAIVDLPERAIVGYAQTEANAAKRIAKGQGGLSLSRHGVFPIVDGKVTIPLPDEATEARHQAKAVRDADREAQERAEEALTGPKATRAAKAAKAAKATTPAKPKVDREAPRRLDPESKDLTRLASKVTSSEGDARNRAILAMRDAGASYSQIAVAMGVVPMTARATVLRLKK